MTATILTPFSTQRNAIEVTRQEYALARKNYQEVCERYDARLPESVELFRAASERRQEAFDWYMKAIRGQ